MIRFRNFLCVAIACFAGGLTAADGSAYFDSQLPLEPGVFDAPLTSTQECIIPVSPLEVKWREPSGGVNAQTGLIVALPGNSNTFDCDRFFDVQDSTWPDAKNVVICNVFYRNNTFRQPYDLGKIQITDTLRGMAKVLEQYPQLDRRRLYLYGASGGGHVSLQVLQCTRHLWAEVHVHCPVTRVTTNDDVQNHGYENDAFGDGLNPMLGFPTEQGSLTDAEFARYQAERALRSPQRNVAFDLPSAFVGSIPRVWSMHGTMDEGLDIQHFYDMEQAVQSAMGISVAPTPVLGGNRRILHEWTFIALDGGTHSYGGAHPLMNSFNKATNHHVPDAFTRSRPAPPDLAVDYSFPWQHGWRFRVTGPLATATILMESTPTAASEWTIYE